MGITLRGTLGLLMLASAFGGVGYWIGVLRAEPREVEGPVEVVEPMPNVLLSVQQLGRLETVAYHMERVVDLRSRQSRLFGLVSVEDAILLIAVGDVVAGVDLGQLGERDVEVDWPSRRAVVGLPEPELFSARLDNQLTRVVKRSTDALARPVDRMETRARQLAEAEMRDAALESGILDEARDHAATTVQALLRTLQFREVEVRFRPATQAD